jgi:hypothetical protein
MLIVTLGCALWNAVAMLCQTPSRGWVLPLFHQVRVTFAVLAGELALVVDLVVELAAGLPALLLHAAIVTAAATAMTAMAGFLEPRMRLSSPDDAGIFLLPELLLVTGLPGGCRSRRTRSTDDVPHIYSETFT